MCYIQGREGKARRVAYAGMHAGMAYKCHVVYVLLQAGVLHGSSIQKVQVLGSGPVRGVACGGSFRR